MTARGGGVVARANPKASRRARQRREPNESHPKRKYTIEERLKHKGVDVERARMGGGAGPGRRRRRGGVERGGFDEWRRPEGRRRVRTRGGVGVQARRRGVAGAKDGGVGVRAGRAR